MGIAPILISGAFVLPASIILGLPITWMLRVGKAESDLAYSVVGILSGFILPIAVFGAGAIWGSFCGAIGGCVAALTWWRNLSQYRPAERAEDSTTD